MAYHALCVAWWSAVCGLAWSMVACLLFEVVGCVVFCQPCEDLVAPSACVGRVLVCVLIRSLETLDVGLRVAKSLFLFGYFCARIGKPFRTDTELQGVRPAATAHAEMPAGALWRFAYVSLLVASLTRSSLASASASHRSCPRKRAEATQHTHGDGARCRSMETEDLKKPRSKAHWRSDGHRQSDD